MLWVGLVLCGIVALTILLSGWWTTLLDFPSGPKFMVYGGAVQFSLGLRFEPPFHIERHNSGLNLWNYWRLRSAVYAIPLYALFLGAAVPTLLVGRLVPKFPRGHCRRCGYNLTGLAEARCPECGTEFAQPESDG